MEKKSYTPAQIEKQFGIKQPTIRAWVRQKKIKGGKIGRIILIDAEDFNKKYNHMLDKGTFFDA